jgi:hypothetical protein
MPRCNTAPSAAKRDGQQITCGQILNTPSVFLMRCRGFALLGAARLHRVLTDAGLTKACVLS